MTEIQDNVLAAETIVIMRSTPCDWVDTPQWHIARIGSEQQQPSHGNRATGGFPIGGVGRWRWPVRLKPAFAHGTHNRMRRDAIQPDQTGGPPPLVTSMKVNNHEETLGTWSLPVRRSCGVQCLVWAGPRADVASPPPGYKLVWSDEFDYEGLPDPAKWDYEEGYVRNREAQFYTRARKENARVENGMLVIEGRKEQFKKPTTRTDRRDKASASRPPTSRSTRLRA